MHRVVQKVLVYIVRIQSGTPEILVFKHRDFPNAGIQVPAGTVGVQESLESAVFREVYEETGLQLSGTSQPLGCHDYERTDRNELHKRNVFYIEAPPDLQDEWTHIVQGDGEDHKLVFDLYWIPLAEAKHKLAVEQGNYLDKIASLPSFT